MKLKGKKIACFLALPQHTRFFLPMREKIMEYGGEILFILPLSEYPFELDLIRRKLPFKYYTDYMNDDVRRKAKDATRELLDNWTRTCYKWDGFSRWPLFKQSWFFESLIEEYFCMERFIEVEKPDMFIANHECSRWGKVIGHLANKKSIPFVTFQEGDYHTDQMAFTVHTEYSTVDLLWGGKTINFLKKYKCSSDKMFPIGNTHIDRAVNEYTSPEMITSIKREINIPSDKKVILFILDLLYGGMENKDAWQELLYGLARLDNEAVCVFKWHPNAFKSTFEKIQEMFKEIYPSAVLLYTYEPYKLLAISDYCVTFGKTTLAVEALAFGKPLFSFPNTNTPDDPYVTMGIAQTVFPPGNWTNLFNTIKNGVPDHIQANVNKYLTEYFYKLDGRSVERAIEMMDYIIDVRREEGMAKGKRQRPKGREQGGITEGRVSFIVPSGNDPEALLSTLASLSQNVKYPDWEVVIVVNNEEMKGILSGLSGDVRIVDADSNSLSFSYNKGAEAASGEYLIFLRPGIVYFKDKGLLDGIENSVAGLPLKNPDMTPYCLGIGYDFNFTPYKINDELKQPEAVGGGFIAMHRDVFRHIAGFDDEIANHLIEPDICLKAKELNIKVRYLPDCLAFNYKETFFREDVSDENWKNRVKFFAKWVGKLPKDEDFLGFAGDLLKV